MMIASSLGRRGTVVSRLDLAKRALRGRRQFSPLAWYNRQIERAPIITKCITSGGKHPMYG